MIYLDNCATTKPRTEVIEVMMKCLSKNFANPSSLHSFGHKVEKEIDVYRKLVANSLNVSKDEIYFTSGGTESNNIAINGLIKKNKRLGNKIITTKIEHASVLERLKEFQDEGFNVKYISVDKNANLNLNELLNEIDENTILVSLSHINNEIGTLNDIKNIVEKIKKINKNTLVHIDGVQAFGKIKVDLRELKCDTYSVSGHKIHGPKGIGALFVKKSLDITPTFYGGGQERGLRSGTENVPGIIGFGMATKLMVDNFENENKKAKKVKNFLIEKLNEIEDVIINTPLNSSPYILSLSIKDIRAEVLLHYLEQDEIYISTASACNSNGTHKSHVLTAMGIDENSMEGTIRICISKDISIDDIEEFIRMLKKYVYEIRNIMKR